MRTNSVSRKRINAETFLGIDKSLDENLLSFKYSPLSYNFTYKKGVLNSKIGISDVTFSSLNSPANRHLLPALPAGINVKSTHLFKKYDFQNNRRDDKLIIRTTTDTFYQISIFTNDTYHFINNLSAVGKCCTENYRYNNQDLFLLASEGGGFYTYDGTTVTSVSNAPSMTSMCVHAERIFATVSGEKNKVWFSDDFNPLNWVVSGEGAGYIDFDDEGGNVNKVIKFLNSVYVFRDYGIEKLTAYGAQSDFTLSKIYVSSQRIYKSTICESGDYIYFMTDDGIFSLDGYNVARVCKNILDFMPVDKGNTVAEAINSKYFIGTRLDFGADNQNPIHDEVGYCVNNAIVVFDLFDKTFSIIRGVDVRHLSAIKIHHEASLLVSFYGNNSGKLGMFNENGKYFSDNLIKYWTTGYTDMGYPDRFKSLREISLTTPVDIMLGVELDGQKVEFSISGGTMPKKVIVNRPFNKMRLYIKSTVANITGISAPTVTVDIL